MTLAALLAALGIVGAQVALSFYLTRRADKHVDRRVVLTEQLADRKLTLAELRRAIEDRDIALSDAKDAIHRLGDTLQLAERQRDDAIKELAETGDSRGVAAGIRAELSAMSGLSAPKATEGG